MLEITIPAYELFDDVAQEFILEDEKILKLEHSLISISKWESRWNKPFLSNSDKSNEEIMDYIRCMTINKGVPETAYLYVTNKQLQEINKYISAPMTATTVNDKKGGGSKEVLTSELIYYYMIASNIPFECEKWHLNRLLTLIRVCGVKNGKPEKQPQSEVMRNNAALNAARKKQLKTRGQFELIKVTAKGSFNKTEKLLKQSLNYTKYIDFDKYGKMGVEALKSATPKDTGETADSWYYKIEKTNGKVTLSFHNSNIQNGFPIAISLQYGHGTRNGGWVEGYDYINPAVRPIFNELAEAAWKEVKGK